MKKVCVIGSSHVMLIKATRLSKQGFDVLVVDSNVRYGGMWRSRVIKGIEIDQACHNFESFPNAYKVLEKYSGVKFVNRIFAYYYFQLRHLPKLLLEATLFSCLWLEIKSCSDP